MVVAKKKILLMAQLSISFRKKLENCSVETTFQTTFTANFVTKKRKKKNERTVK